MFADFAFLLYVCVLLIFIECYFNVKCPWVLRKVLQEKVIIINNNKKKNLTFTALIPDNSPVCTFADDTCLIPSSHVTSHSYVA